jgi:PPM family protein phosphatase
MSGLITLTHAGHSISGQVRTQNQDRWFSDPRDRIYLVADGIDGNPEGALAATIVAETLPQLIKQKIRDFSAPFHQFPLQDLITELSDRLHQEIHHQPQLEGMGSTVVVALIHRRQALIGHLGDSRAYLWRQNTLQQITQDHSLLQLLLDRRELSSKEIAHHPSRHQLTRYVGMAQTPQPDIHIVELVEGDLILLCSDGLSNMLSHDQMLTILNEQSSPQVCCQRCVEWANTLGGKDNITCIVIKVLETL